MNRVLEDMNLPDLIRNRAANRLVRIEHAKNVYALELAQERAEGFVEGLEAARALTPATLEALFMAIDVATTERRQALTP